MKALYMAAILTQLLSACSGNIIVETDTVVKTDTIVQTDTVSQMDTVPATFIDSITTQYSQWLGDSEQLLVVFNNKASSVASELHAYELHDSVWTEVDSLCFPAGIGKKGFAPYGKKVEGDGKSPTGIYSITHYFSKFSDFEAKLEKIKITKKTVWIDDVKDTLYNTYVEQNAAHPRKGEKLYRSKDALYDYVMVINYNVEERIPGKGSAIFLHVWSRPCGPTAGCVSLKKEDVLSLFEWIDADKHPKIVMGSLEDGMIFQIEGTDFQ